MMSKERREKREGREKRDKGRCRNTRIITEMAFAGLASSSSLVSLFVRSSGGNWNYLIGKSWFSGSLCIKLDPIKLRYHSFHCLPAIVSCANS